MVPESTKMWLSSVTQPEELQLGWVRSKALLHRGLQEGPPLPSSALPAGTEEIQQGFPTLPLLQPPLLWLHNSPLLRRCLQCNPQLR